MLFLGLDTGTQSTKGLVVDVATGSVVARASSSHGDLPNRADGAAEQDPELWWNALCTVVRELVASGDFDPSQLCGLGISGQQHGFVPLDAEHRVIRPAKLWCDTQTAAEAAELGVATGFTASKVLWMKRHEPDNFARLAHVLLPHDWIDFRLTGERWMECGDASGTGWFDARARAFDPEAMAAIDAGLERFLPPLVGADEAPAVLLDAVADELGLPRGLPVAPGAGDNMASAIGSGAVRAGVCVMSLGTSGTVFTRTDSAVVDPEGLIAPFCDSTGGWLPLLCTMNVTGVTDSIARALGRDLASLTEAAGEVPPGADGLLLLPHFVGERVPDLPHATGKLDGLNHANTTPGHLFRAALEGTSLNLAWGVRRLRALGIEPTLLRVVGGAAENALWCRILAGCIDAPVQRLEEPESAALGAALQAAHVVTHEDYDSLVARNVRTAGDAIEPDRDWTAAYAEQLDRFDASLSTSGR